LLDELGVKYILSLRELSDPRLELVKFSENVFVYQNRAAQPRCVWQGATAQRKLVSLTEESPQTLSANTDAAESGSLLLSDSSFPGWRVSVDGAAQEMKSSAVQRSVALEQGQRNVWFVYFPTTFRVGLFLSGLALGLMAAARVKRMRY
jgi:uncharacterized membrane protein YfhO